MRSCDRMLTGREITPKGVTPPKRVFSLTWGPQPPYNRPQITSTKVCNQKREVQRHTAKLIQNNVYCFFITIFRVAIPAFRFAVVVSDGHAKKTKQNDSKFNERFSVGRTWSSDQSRDKHFSRWTTFTRKFSPGQTESFFLFIHPPKFVEILISAYSTDTFFCRRLRYNTAMHLNEWALKRPSTFGFSRIFNPFQDADCDYLKLANRKI